MQKMLLRLMLLVGTILVSSLGIVSAQAKTVVTYWTWNAAAYANPGEMVDGQPSVSFAQEAFEAAHPEIDLDVKIFSYSDYLNQIQLNMAAGTGPDIVALQAGVLLNTYSEFLADLTLRATTEWGDKWADRFLSLGLDQSRNAKGDLVGLPLMNSAAGFLWYNKTIFDKDGLKPPMTWDEWIATSKALKDKGTIGFYHGAADAWVDLDMIIAIANELAPGKIYDAEAGKIPWTDPDLVKAMDYWKQMFSNGIMQDGALAATQYPDAHQNFTSGKAGMMLMGVWNDFSVLTNAGFKGSQQGYGFTDNYEYGTIPFPDLNGDGKPGVPFGGPDVIVAMNQSSQKQDAAWTVLSWMVSEDGQKQQAKLLNVPSIKDVPFDDSDAKSDFAKQVLADQITQLETASGKREFIYPDLKTALSDALQSVAAGQQTPEEAMAAVEAVSQTVKR